MPRTEWISDADLARVRDHHQTIGQDTLLDPEEGDDDE